MFGESNALLDENNQNDRDKLGITGNTEAFLFNNPQRYETDSDNENDKISHYTTYSVDSNSIN